MHPNNTSDIVVDGKLYNTFTEPPVALAEERRKTSFPVRQLTYYFDGGQKETEANEEFWNRLERDPLLNNKDFYDLDYEENRKRTFQLVARMHTYIKEFNFESPRRVLSPFGLLFPSTATRLSVHFGLFVGAIKGQGTDKQYQYWVDRGCLSLKNFYGCFAMTELGHGSNVAGLETTATYDPSTEEFIINTPSVAASKWWIGGAAHSANHTVCFARLIVNGKDYGVYNFVVQLRDCESHNVLPGIALGDIGKKMGRDGIDNGWIQFTNVRIPRTHMLMRYAQVTPEGEVIEPPLAQLTYGALIYGRVSMSKDSWIWSRRFLTIAIRYAAARRQFANSPDQPETKLLDYVYHQRRLIPLLAQSIATEAAATECYNMYDSVTATQQTVDPKDKKALANVVSQVKELFALSAGLKAFATWGCADTIDECRQACGGNGYSGYNGFGQGYDDWVVNCTWEGDNNVLCLSSGRALIQSGLDVLAGKPVRGVADYIGRINELKDRKLNGRDLTDPSVLIEAWESVSAQNIIDTAKDYQKLTSQDKQSKKEALERLSNARFRISRLHTRTFQVRSLARKVQKADPSIQPILTKIATLFALWAIEKDSSPFLQYGFLAPEDLDTVTELVTKYCSLVRDQVIGVTDAFNLSDYFINAPIGNYNGDVYRNYFDKTNERNPIGDAKAPYYAVQEAFFKRSESEVPPLEDI